MNKPYRISGSRAASVLGLSQWSTPVRVWLEIMGREFCESRGYEFPIFEGNASTTWGSAFEYEIINKVERIKGVDILSREKYFEQDYLTCHVDGIAGGTLIENKTTSEYNFRESFGDEETDKIPINYQIQIQHNLYLTGLEKCLMPVLIFPKRPDDYTNSGIDIEKINKSKWVDVLCEMGNLKFYEINSNPELQSLMLTAYSEFWEKNILGGIEPEPRSYDDIKLLCPEPVGTIIADDEVARLKAEYDDINIEIGNGGALAKRKEQIKVAIFQKLRISEKILDDDSKDKYIVRDNTGKKIASYGKNKNGVLIFR